METTDSTLARVALSEGKKVTAILKSADPCEFVLAGDEVEVVGFVTHKIHPTHERDVVVDADFLEVNDPKWLGIQWFSDSGESIFTIH